MNSKKTPANQRFQSGCLRTEKGIVNLSCTSILFTVAKLSIMASSNKKQDYISLEKYLSLHFNFRLNEITGSMEFKKQPETQWEELNEFNIPAVKTGGI